MRVSDLVVCYGAVNTGRWCQEWYETASRHARRRAAELRRLGYHVSAEGMGPQVTEVGRIKMTILDIRPGTHEDTFDLPPVTTEPI